MNAVENEKKMKVRGSQFSLVSPSRKTSQETQNRQTQNKMTRKIELLSKGMKTEHRTPFEESLVN